MEIILWTKFEDDGDVTSPQRGVPGTVVGAPAYAAVQFGNGERSTLGNYCTFPTAGNDINLDKGTIEWWGKMKHISGAPGTRYIIDFMDVANGGLLFYFAPGPDNFTLAMSSGGVVTWVLMTTALPPWLIDQIFHFAFTWDRTGTDIGGGKTAAIYIDGVEEASTLVGWGADTVLADMFVGINNGLTAAAGQFIDNLKTYNVCKTDFSDRFDEDADAGPITPTDLLCNDLTNPVHLDTPIPYFSAIFHHPNPLATADYYQLQINKESDFTGDMVWDSGKTAMDNVSEGDRCPDIDYAEPILNALRLWSKLESDDDVITPQVGVGGNVEGDPSYAPVRFGNGLFTTEGNGARFPTVANDINMEKGTIEFWTKLNWQVAYPPLPRVFSNYCYFFSFRIEPAYTGIYFFWDWVANELQVRVAVDGAGPAVYSSGFRWTPGDVVHLAVTWDRAGIDIGGGRTLALYIDNVLRGSSTLPWAASTDFNPFIYIATSRGFRAPVVGGLDNLKTYNEVKTDFSDRNNESAGEIPTEGEVLIEGVIYYWRIKFWDTDGNEGDWSEELAYFSLGVAAIDITPPKYKLTIGNNILQCEADKQDVFEMHFTLRQNGGCCEFNLSLRAPEFTVNLGDQVSIYLFGDANPWYVGRVLERDRPGSSSRVRKYAGYGHFEQLNGGDLVDKDYGTASGNPALDTIREIVIDILDTYVRPYTSLISADNTYIQDVAGYTVTELIFDKVKPMEALTELCELATNYEFGVDENGDFYFRSISTNITERKWVGKHIASYSPKENMRNLINYWYLEGGLLVAGSNYNTFVQDAASIARWGVRSGKATVPDGFNTAEIARWGNDLLEKTKDPVIKATITGINIEETETRIWPRGEMRLTSEDGKQALDFPIRAAAYHITPSGLTADIELGPKATDIRDYFADVLKQISKEREQLAHDVRQLASGAAVTGIWDADHDTGIQVEEGADDDTIRFDVAGTEVLNAAAALWVFNENGDDVDFRWEGAGSTHLLFLDAGNDNVNINAAAISADYDLGLLGDGVLCLTETATPAADANYGKVYCKNDNKLYFQDGAGVEHDLMVAAAATAIWDADVDTGIQTEKAADEDVLRFDTAGTERLAIHDGWIDQHFSNLLDPYGGVESWSQGAGVVPDGWTFAGAGASVAREAGTVRHGNFSAKITRVGNDCSLSRAIEEFAYYQNRTVILGCWVWASVATRGRIQIADGVGTNESGYHTGGSSWEFLTVTRTIDNAATSVTPHLRVDNGNTDVYFDGAILVEGAICPTYMPAVKTVWLPVAITDANWSGDAYSTVDDGLLDLSAFGNGCPPKIKAVYLFLQARDSDSANTVTYIRFAGSSPVSGAVALHNLIYDQTNDEVMVEGGWVPCNSNGDVYYDILASGANTCDVWIKIIGYILGE